MSSARLRTIGFGLVVVALAAALLWCRGRSGSSSAPASSTTDEKSTARSELSDKSIPHLPEVGHRRPLAAEAGPPAKPIIDSITVAKPRVCTGEENLVTIKAHTEGGVDDAYLQINLDGQSGTKIPLVGRRADREAPDEPYRVTVVGRNRVSVSANVPKFVVEDCAVPTRLRVGYRLLPNSLDEMELRAELINLGSSEKFHAVRYEWDFGDGTNEVSKSAIVAHDFWRKRNDRLETSFLVRVTAISKDGKKIVGRRSITRPSRAFEHLAYKGIVIVEYKLNPRFPELDSKGDVKHQVTMWHSYDKPVYLRKAVRLRFRTDGGPQPEPVELQPSSVLGRSVIQPGEKLKFRVRFEASADKEISFEEYRFRGITADGRLAVAGFSLMRPPPRPGPETGSPIADPLLAAKIWRAQKLLGTDSVSDEDLMRLEREGKFENLQPIPNYQAPANQRPLPK